MRWWRRKSRDADLDRETRSHLQLEAEERQDCGLSPEEAHYAAKRALGNTTQIKEAVRATWGLTWLERSKQDLIYACRAFGRTPGFTTIVVLTLALGIGATTAMFSIVNAILLHPLPYKNPHRLVIIWENSLHNLKAPPFFDSYSDFEIWKHARSFEQLSPATWATGGALLTGAGPARDVLAMPVGLDFFRLLGVPPEIGRTFQSDDLHRSCTIVLRHRFWVKVFGGQKNAIDKHVELNRTACTIIGVMPSGFSFYPEAASVFRLITPASKIASDPDHASVAVFGLLRPGVTIQRAQQELRRLFQNAHRDDPDGIWKIPSVHPLAQEFDYLTGPSLRRSIVVLFGAVVFVLLIACVNIANLLLGRFLVRQKELAVRAALGSGRKRLIRQLLTESLLLSFTGAAVGILLAIAAVHAFRALNPIRMPPGTPVSVNLWVLGFTAVLSVVTALLFGLIPALRASRVDVMDALKAGGRTASFNPAARLFGKTLVAAEVMLSLALLAGAGLLIESVNRLASVPLGFRTDHILITSLSLRPWSYAKARHRVRFYREVLDSAGTLPGVSSVALASSIPLTQHRHGVNTLAIEGKPRPNSKTAPRDVGEVSISPGYFRVMSVPLERGRRFGGADREKSVAVAIVNQALAREYFPHQNPIGQQIQVGESKVKRPWLTIVGVVGDEKDQNFFHQMAWEGIPFVYRPLAQAPPFGVSLVLRTPKDKTALGAAIQKQVAAIDPSVPVGEVVSMKQQLSKRLSYPSFRTVVLGAFAGLALLLATVGLYGVLSQSIAQRTREFGIRMALGAQKQDVLALIIRQGMLLTLAGIAAGLAVALALTRFLSAFLYGIKPTDPRTMAGVSLLLLLVSFLATYIPARRAARVDPMTALRYE
jgi:putative ABC transport system permease protein